ncbi:MAG: nuclear transport factor 2 family protein, partial [Verrucomicrobiota bacterium]
MTGSKFVRTMVVGIALCGAWAFAAPAGEPAVIAVLKADKARLAAMIAGNGAALADLMSDQLQFVHSDGRVESKGDYVKNMMADDTEYKDAKTS